MSADRMSCRDHQGTMVCLKTHVWFSHVLRKHAYLEGVEQLDRRAVEQPTAINQDDTYPHRKCFYRLPRMPDSPIDEFLKVVVEYSENAHGEEEGENVTAYTVDFMKPEEERLWPGAS